MPKMSLAWALLYFAGLFASFINPIYGVLTYLLEYYLRPALHWWGASLPDLRYNFTVAVVLTGTYLLRRNSLPDIGPARRGPTMCLVGLAVLMGLVTVIAVNPELSWEKVVAFLKMMLFYLLIVGTVRSEKAFDLFVAAHIAGAGWWGWEAFLDPKREAGRLVNIGSGDTLGDNAAAIHLLSVLPFLAVYILMCKDKRWRALAFGVAPFVVNALVLCNSRGSIVGLLAAGMAALWFAKTGHRLRTMAAGVLGVAVLLYLADPEFIHRQQSTSNYEDDGSARSRLASWRAAVDLIGDYPLGAGGQGFAELSPIYIPDIVAAHSGEKRDPHNTVVLVASEWGLAGLALFLGYYFTCHLVLQEVRKRSQHGDFWFYRAVAIQTAMIGIFISGLFTDRLYAEAPLWMGGLAVALNRVHAHALATTSMMQEQPVNRDARTRAWTPPAGSANAGSRPPRPATTS